MRPKQLIIWTVAATTVTWVAHAVGTGPLGRPLGRPGLAASVPGSAPQAGESRITLLYTVNNLGYTGTCG